jgi:hypothetical protein
MNRLKLILLQQGLSEEEAENEIDEARQEAYEFIEQGNFAAAMEICEIRWGLEPDYIEDFLL